MRAPKKFRPYHRFHFSVQTWAIALFVATATAIAWYSGFGLSIYDFEKKEVGQMLTERGIFPNWKGPAPIYVYYEGKGHFCEVWAGVGGEKEFMHYDNFLFDGPIDWTARINPAVVFHDSSSAACPDGGRGRDNILVIYHPHEQRYRAYQWTNSTISHLGLSRGTPMDWSALKHRPVGLMDLELKKFPFQMDRFFKGMFTEVVIPPGLGSKYGHTTKSWLLDKNRAIGIQKDKEKIAKIHSGYE